MDLTSTDILFGLGAVAAAVVVASAVYWLSGRLTRPDGPGPASAVPPVAAAPASAPLAPASAPPAPATASPAPAWTEDTTAAWVENLTAPYAAPDAGADPHGRHRAPEELLRASTYRLSADRVARAKVQDQSQAIPSPSRSRS